MAKSDNIYFAAKDGEEAAAIMCGKIFDWTNTLRSNGFLEKLKATWSAYHGAYFSDSSGHSVTFGGEQGELTNLAVNHLRNLGQHMMTMTCASRPSLEARAANTDYKSLVQTQLANGLLDYYMREKRMERYIKNAVECSIVLGAGYVKMEWDATEGKVVESDEETGMQIHEGDVKFSNLTPFDVVFDMSKDGSDHDWIISRTFKNRHDLSAKYPEYKELILGLETKDKANGFYLKAFDSSESEEVAMYTFHHKKTDSMPEGRELVFCSEKIILLDQPLPYKRIPIFRISPNDYLGTPFGYSSLFDLMPLQEAINSLYSSVLSNHTAFGVQNIFVKTGSNVNMTNLTGSLNIIEGLEPPMALNLQATSPQTTEFLGILERSIETISGINSVTRGNPEANLKSGTALALVQSMAIQFMSGLQQQYVALMEDLGTGLIEILKDYAQTPRVASIVGKNNKTYIKEFKSEDLQEVNRVVVDVGNALARTTAGRIQMAEQMLQMKADSFTIDQYLQVINTGKIEVMTDPLVREENLIELENEQMMAGTIVPVLAIDDHMVHIKQHKSVLADPSLRQDQNISKVVLDHIMEHINIARQMDPGLTQALGQQAIPPSAPQGPTPGEMIQEPGPMPNAPQAGMPNMPTPAAPLQEAPMTPEAGMANAAGVPQGPPQ